MSTIIIGIILIILLIISLIPNYIAMKRQQADNQSATRFMCMVGIDAILLLLIITTLIIKSMS